VYAAVILIKINIMTSSRSSKEFVYCSTAFDRLVAVREKHVLVAMREEAHTVNVRKQAVTMSHLH
jgi:hypothetical protein